MVCAVVEKKPLKFRVTLALAFVVGLTSLVYEVVATKTLFFFFVENTYSVGIVLATFLLGLAGGTVLFRLLNERMSPWTLILLSQLLAGTYALVQLANFGYLPAVLDTVERAMPSSWTFLALKMLICGVHVGLPALFMGVVFPIVLARGAGQSEKAAVGISWVYVLDLAGSAMGALLAGIYALPVLGIDRTVYLTAALNFALAGWAATARRSWPGLAGAAAALAATAYLSAGSWRGPEVRAAPRDGPSWFDKDSWVFFNVIDQKYSPYEVITVGRHPKLGKIMYANYRVLCVENRNDSEYEMGALVGLFFEKKKPARPARTLSLGLGCGYTLMALEGSPALDPIDVVEINPVVIEMARKHFAESTGNVFASKKVRIVEDEGFHYLRTSQESYDAIVMDIENPSVLQSGPLYTDEFFARSRECLSPGGLLAVWAYRGGLEYCKVLYNTMRRYFGRVVIRSNIDGNYVYFASNASLDDIFQTPAELKFQKMVEAYPTDAISTLGNQVLQRLFKPREYFFFPDWFEDPYIPRLVR
jgi:spermidine synthase